jgi:tripartite-type tricarboxylate transporter receptor subunit TctC
VRIIVPAAPGGGTDLVARVLAQHLSEALGQQFVVDNRGGAGTTLGSAVVAKSPPDGYTLILHHVSLAFNASYYRKLPYDTLKDFAPITLVATQPFLVVVHPSLPVKSVRELVALARARPGQINYASAGSGTAAHLAAEMFRLDAGINIVHIPYKGISQALTDTLAGATQIMILSPITAMAQVKAGKVRALAVTTARRSNALPEVPTMQESGIPGYEFSSWYGLLAPRGVPAPVIARLNDAVNKALQQNDLRSRLAAEAAEPMGGTPGQFAEHLKREVKRFSDLVKQIKLQAD